MNSEPIHVFGHQNTQRLCLGLSFYGTRIINLRKLSKKSSAKPLRAGADGPIQEHNTKRAACFTCQRTRVSSTSSVYRRAKTLVKLSLTLLSRAHREFTPLQLEFLANIVRLYRGEASEDQHNSADFLATRFPDTEYVGLTQPPFLA